MASATRSASFASALAFATCTALSCSSWSILRFASSLFDAASSFDETSTTSFLRRSISFARTT